MSSETAGDQVIELSKVSKCYFLYDRPEDRLKQMLFGRRRQYYKEFWALHDVSFSVKKGACVGIIGRNGAGKSTLLQIISKIVAPTSGTLNVQGKVAALLELGTGFNPEFTGKENVFLNGSILGMTQDELSLLYDDIVAFADIGDFIHQPVKTYSSGMLVRLAFAVAIHVDPDILIIDEALSVGDAKFQAKCFRKFQEFRDRRKTILFVTHATEQVVRHCDHAILIEGGRVAGEGDPLDITNRYLSLIFDTKPIEKDEASPKNEQTEGARVNGSGATDEPTKFRENPSMEDRCSHAPGYNKGEYRWGNREAEIIDYLIGDESYWHVNHFASGASVKLYLKIKYAADVERPIYGLTIKTPDGVTVFGTNSKDLFHEAGWQSRKSGDVEVVKFEFRALLNAGHFMVSVGVASESGGEIIPLDRRYDLIEIYITQTQKHYGIVNLEAGFQQIGGRRM